MEEETVGVLLERTSRSTRGKRMTKLVDDELEADEEFWGQDAFKEAGEDAEYEAEDDVIDEFDSDFDEEEANIEEEEKQEEDERVKRKRLLPPGSKPVKKDGKGTAQKTKDLDAIEAAVAAAMEPLNDEQKTIIVEDSPKEIISQEVHDSMEDLESEKIVRKSTRTAVVVRQAEREALRAAMHVATIKPVKKKREGERRITQEDMLLEAAQTEILNRQNLERMLAREEEVKQKAIIHKTVYTGPTIRFYSRDGNNFLEFCGEIPEAEKLFMPATKPGVKKPTNCVVTGLPAKYIDPLTGFPYATKEAFNIIRKRVEKKESSQRKATPGKKLRSERIISGRPHSKTPRSAHKSISQRHLSRIEARHIDFKGDVDDVIQDLPLAPDLTRQKSIAQPMDEVKFLGSSMSTPISEQSFDDNRASTLKPSDRLGNTENLSKGTRQPRQVKDELLWVEIPPPREELIDDDYLLDDLTSLDFGPILTLEHGVRVDLQDQDEQEIGDPTLGPISLLDFSANTAF